MKMQKQPAKIVGHVVRPRDGMEVFFVTSQSQDGKLYRVKVRCSRLVCGCPASVYTGNCAHRKLVHAALEAEMREKRATRDVVTVSVNPAYGAKSAPRQSLLNRSQAFSLMR